MYRKICWYTALLILLVFTIAGCDKLSKYDLSGQIEMELKTDGSTYRRIHKFDDYGEDLTELQPKAPSETALDIAWEILTYNWKTYSFDISELYIILEFMKDLSVGGDTYSFKVDFVDNPPERFNYLKVLNSQREELSLIVIEKSI